MNWLKLLFLLTFIVALGCSGQGPEGIGGHDPTEEATDADQVDEELERELTAE